MVHALLTKGLGVIYGLKNQKALLTLNKYAQYSAALQYSAKSNGLRISGSVSMNVKVNTITKNDTRSIFYCEQLRRYGHSMENSFYHFDILALFASSAALLCRLLALSK